MRKISLGLVLLLIMGACSPGGGGGHQGNPTIPPGGTEPNVNNEPNTGTNTTHGALVPNFFPEPNSSATAMCAAYYYLCSGGFDPATLNSQVVLADGSLTVNPGDGSLLSNGAPVPEEYVPGPEYTSGCEALYLCNYKNPGEGPGQNNPQGSPATSASDINFRCWSADYTCDGFSPPWNPKCSGQADGCKIPAPAASSGS